MGVRVYPTVPRIYIDMDGPLANFDAAYKKAGMTPEQYKVTEKAFFNLDVVPNARSAFLTLMKLKTQIWFLSKPPDDNPYAATDKLLWALKYFPEVEDRVILTVDKGCVGTHKDILIDDHPEWANASNFPGTVITWKDNWPEIVNLLFNGPQYSRFRA